MFFFSSSLRTPDPSLLGDPWTSYQSAQELTLSRVSSISADLENPTMEKTDGLKDVCVLSHVQLFATPWTVPHQAPLSMEFCGQE